MVKVTFSYDENCRKWEATISGVEDETEAKQAFNAVLITARQAKVTMEHKTVQKSAEEYLISSVAI